jgi:radical SAM-linked protein
VPPRAADHVAPVQRLRIRYAKRGRMRFTSHRDFQRALERALRRAEVPMAFSSGFSPHPKISYANAAPTGVASEAEYLEIGVVAECDPDDLRARLDAALPPGLDIVEVVVARTPDLAARLEASRWLIRLPEVDRDVAAAAVAAFLAASSVEVQRLTKNGMRTFDARAAVLDITVLDITVLDIDVSASDDGEVPCAILQAVVRQVTPAVRPDDVLAGLQRVADLVPPVPPVVTREMQGPLEGVTVGDPLAVDRDVDVQT